MLNTVKAHSFSYLRPLFALVLFVFASIFMINCRSFWSLESYKDALPEWCELLARCATDDSAQSCEQKIGALLEQGRSGDAYADADSRWTAWLTHYSEKACTTNCQHARRCLDFRPICSDGACGSREDCCGFSTAVNDCDTRQDPGKCCVVKGRRCTDHADCCPGAGFCEGGVCDGVLCRDVLSDCTQDFQCCTQSCRNNKCAEDVCSQNDSACQDNKDCCSKYCDPISLKCSSGTCAAESAPCFIDLKDGPPCCGDLECVEESGGKGVCSQSTCNSVGVECTSDASCCSLKCDQEFRKCTECRVDGEACENAGQCCNGACFNGACGVCAKENQFCNSDGECCTGKCINGSCAPLCTSGCDHSVCQIGAALSMQCSNNTVNTACVDSVCKVDPYCCCTQWDSLCVSEAKKQCPASVCVP